MAMLEDERETEEPAERRSSSRRSRRSRSMAAADRAGPHCGVRCRPSVSSEPRRAVPLTDAYCRAEPSRRAEPPADVAPSSSNHADQRKNRRASAAARCGHVRGAVHQQSRATGRAARCDDGRCRPLRRTVTADDVR